MPTTDVPTTPKSSAEIIRIGSRDAHGSWSPGSLDLVAELPTLLAAATRAGYDVHRVDYHLGAWLPAPRKLIVDGQLIKLSGYRTQPASTITLIDTSNANRANNARLDFDVIPPAVLTTSRAA